MQIFDIDGIHINIDEKLKKYVTRKLRRLDRYISRRSRTSAHAEVKLKEDKTDGRSESTCEMILYLPKEILRVAESTVNMYAAVDIVEEKMKQRLKKYKAQHNNPRLHQRAIARFRRAV